MEMKNKRIKGIITSFRPLGYDHTETKQIGLLLGSYTKEKTPCYEISIEDSSGKKEIVEMPIKISNEFERGFERGLVGQKVILEFDEQNLGPKWMNEDNLALLLYSEFSTKRELLQIVEYEEQQENQDE